MNEKEMNLESLRDLNLGLDKSNFRLDMGLSCLNLAMDKPKFVANNFIFFSFLSRKPILKKGRKCRPTQLFFTIKK